LKAESIFTEGNGDNEGGEKNHFLPRQNNAVSKA